MGKRKKSLIGYVPSYASNIDNFAWEKMKWDFREIRLPMIRERDVWGDNKKVRITYEEI